MPPSGQRRRPRWLALAVVLVVPAAAGGITAIIVNHQPKHTRSEPRASAR